jgi:hypothetical protein
MKKLSFSIFILIFTCILQSASGQKITLKSGNLDFLKGLKVLNLEYTYDNMKVGKFDSEQEYIDKKVSDYNEKDPGSGDRWHEGWVNDRQERFEPKFEQLLNETFEAKKTGLEGKQNADSPYTMIFHTTFTEPGFNIGITRKNAYIDAEVTFVKTDDPSTVLAKIIIDNSPGRDAFGNDYDTGYRIQEAYAKAGKELAYFLWKKSLK